MFMDSRTIIACCCFFPSRQLILSVEMFSSDEALRFLPASLLIMQDKVSAVRRSGVELV